MAARQLDPVRRLRWFKEARFGMFVHWGLYSLLGRTEWIVHNEQIPRAEYARLADRFRPGPAPMRKWCALAKAAGMKYVVMTTKHHDGYCLWDTKETDFNSVRTGPRRDLLAGFTAACREQGLWVGLYYSLMDWRHPDGLRCRDATGWLQAAPEEALSCGGVRLIMDGAALVRSLHVHSNTDDRVPDIGLRLLSEGADEPLDRQQRQLGPLRSQGPQHRAHRRHSFDFFLNPRVTKGDLRRLRKYLLREHRLAPDRAQL